MKTTALLFALAACCGSALAASPSDTMTKFHAALAAGDKAGAIALLSPDVIIYESGYAERSRDDYAKTHLAGDIDYSRTVARKVVHHIEHTEGNTATVLEETSSIGTFKGKPVNALGLETAVLERQGDGWVIVHLHWSSRKAK
ncbi:MAG: nuclear transport factor 2 family protein [Pseudomonadota bacterium]